MSTRSGRARRWAAGGAAVAAALAALLTWRSVVAPVACAGDLAAVRSGRATFYTLTSGGGNCSFPGPPADGLFVALSPGEYAAAARCGGYLSVRGPEGVVRVQVTDQCPECESGHIDLSAKAFALIGDPVQGIVPVTYSTLVDPPTPRPIGLRVKEGSSRWWLAVLAVDTGNALSAVAVRQGTGWMPLQRADYNYWIARNGAGTGPFTIRIRDVRGHEVTASGIRLAPGTVQRTGLRLYGSGSGTAVPAPRRKSPHPVATVRRAPAATLRTPAPEPTLAPAIAAAVSATAAGTPTAAASVTGDLAVTGATC